MLSRRISVSKKLNNLPVKAQLIWIWTIPYLDDFGCYTADPEDIKAEALPKNRCVKVKDIATALQQAHDAGLIVIYEVDGKHYQKYVNFESFQTFRADRNRQHEYPDFDPKTAKVANGKPTTTSDSRKLVLSEVSVKLREDTKNECVIFDHWNFYKGRQKGNGKGKWKSHDEMTHEIKQAIEDRLKQYTPEQLNRAIDNYAKVLLSKDFAWSYAWTLRQFLTRHQKPPNQTELQLYRWLDSGFAEDDYLTPNAKARRIKRVRDQDERPVEAASTDEKLLLRSALPKVMQDRLKNMPLND
jgi:hypothetical protein